MRHFTIINEIFPWSDGQSDPLRVFLIFVWCIVLMFVYQASGLSVRRDDVAGKVRSASFAFFLWIDFESTGVPLDRVTRMYRAFSRVLLVGPPV